MPGTAGRRLRNMKCIVRESHSADFGVNLRAALLGVLVFFDDDDASAFAHDETIAGFIKRPTRFFRIVVFSVAQCMH